MLIKKIQGKLEERNGYHYEFDMHSKPIGQGGMGVVYKGFKIYDVIGTRTVVAIKAMFEGLPSEVYERAEREASIRLRNENLVEMLGFISETDVDPYGMKKNKYYVVSEYLNGIVLSDLLSGQFKDKDGIEIPYAKQLYTSYISDRERTSIEIIKNILSGVSALHDKKYIHRDIDPTNIMVTDKGAIKLIDFGIAKNVGTLSTIDKSLTQAGKFIGKAEYASPELVLGDVKNQGFHTDIYAIGILLYQLLVGRQPFSGSKYEILQMQLNDKLPLKHIKNIPLRKIVKKATEKNRNDRYMSAAQMRVDLDKAEVQNSNPIIKYWKAGAAIIAASAACACLIFGLKNNIPEKVEHRNNDLLSENKISVPSTKPTQVVPHYTYSGALEKLNPDDNDKAQQGLEELRTMAANGNVDATATLGLLYVVDDKNQGENVKKYRENLGLANDESKDSSVYYLEKIKNAPNTHPEVLVIYALQVFETAENGEEINEILKSAENKLNDPEKFNFDGRLDVNALKGKIKKIRAKK